MSKPEIASPAYGRFAMTKNEKGWFAMTDEDYATVSQAAYPAKAGKSNMSFYLT